MFEIKIFLQQLWRVLLVYLAFGICMMLIGAGIFYTGYYFVQFYPNWEKYSLYGVIALWLTAFVILSIRVDKYADYFKDKYNPFKNKLNNNGNN